MIKATFAKLLTLKAAAVLATVSTGGVAVAATTGILPNPLSDGSPAPAHSTPETNHPAGTSSPSLRGLCTAFLAGAGAEHGKALESPAFTALVTAAGGKDAVESYCTELVATSPGTATTDHPAGRPTSPPGRSGDHPTGPPTLQTTGTSTTAPTTSLRRLDA